MSDVTLTTAVLGLAVVAAALTVTPGLDTALGATGATLLAFGLRLATGPAPR